MRVFTEDNIGTIKHPVVTVGAFDGVHRGHAMLLTYLCDKARALGGESVVVTFNPHPRLVLKTVKAPLLFLTTHDEKLTLLGKQGVDNVVVLKFTYALSMMDACTFAGQILSAAIGMKHLIVGFNNGFGNRRDSDYDTIVSCGHRLGYGVDRIGSLGNGAKAISSTVIRESLLRGDLVTANDLLGYCYFIKGTIVEGRKLGRSIGFPTANISSENDYKLIPCDGVYVVTVTVNGKEYGGMANIGTRPTVNTTGEPRSVEVHIFDFDASVYRQKVTLSFLYRLSNEIQFSSVEELRRQLFLDTENALRYLSGA